VAANLRRLIHTIQGGLAPNSYTVRMSPRPLRGRGTTIQTGRSSIPHATHSVFPSAKSWNTESRPSFGPCCPIPRHVCAFAKRMECAQLAGAFYPGVVREGGPMLRPLTLFPGEFSG
jgi:hypothetical protein